MEHWEDWEDGAPKSHIHKHQTEEHPEEPPPKMQLEVLKVCSTAIQRQIGEATRMRTAENRGAKLHKNKKEYTRLGGRSPGDLQEAEQQEEKEE